MLEGKRYTSRCVSPACQGLHSIGIVSIAYSSCLPSLDIDAVEPCPAVSLDPTAKEVSGTFSPSNVYFLRFKPPNGALMGQQS